MLEVGWSFILFSMLYLERWSSKSSYFIGIKISRSFAYWIEHWTFSNLKSMLKALIVGGENSELRIFLQFINVPHGGFWAPNLALSPQPEAVISSWHPSIVSGYGVSWTVLSKSNQMLMKSRSKLEFKLSVVGHESMILNQ